MSPTSPVSSKNTEFDEFDIKEEATLETKNYIYTLLSDAHYQKKRNLDREFGKKTTASDFESEAKHSEIESRGELNKQEQLRRLEYAKQLNKGEKLSDESSSLDEEESGKDSEEDIDPELMKMMVERFNKYK